MRIFIVRILLCILHNRQQNKFLINNQRYCINIRFIMYIY
jgi:hypothetical protein